MMPDEINVKFTSRPYRPKQNELYTLKFFSSLILLFYAVLILFFYYLLPGISEYNQSVEYCNTAKKRILENKLSEIAQANTEFQCSPAIAQDIFGILANPDQLSSFDRRNVLIIKNQSIADSLINIEVNETQRVKDLQDRVNNDMQKYFKIGIVETASVDWSVLGSNIPLGQKYDIYNQYWQASKQDLDQRTDQKVNLDLQEFYTIILSSGKSGELQEYIDFYNEYSLYTNQEKIQYYDRLAARKQELKAILK